MESDSPGTGGGGALLVLEPKSLRSFSTNDEYLLAMKEDLADWISCLHSMHVDAEDFLAVLETGVLLCRHANHVQHFLQTSGLQGAVLTMRSYHVRRVPEGQVVYRENVRAGTFQARDNVSNFISWCRQLGIPDVLRFETDDLVLRKNERSVILCMLELARVGAKLGMPAPTIVRMEEEIDAELAGDPPPQIKTCDMKSLDELVRDLVGRCTCPVQFPMVKIGEGKYKIGDSLSLIFVRVLRKHVMVRVGGGWDTLEHYLDKHDPCRCNFLGHRGSSAPGPASSGPRHQVSRRASGAALVVSRSSAGATSSPSTPMSPRRMSTSAAATTTLPAHSSTAAGGGESQIEMPSASRGESPAPGAGYSLSFRRLSSPVPAQHLDDRSAGTPCKPLSKARDQSSAQGHAQQQPRLSTSLPRQTQDHHHQQQQHQQQPQRTQVPQHLAVQRCKSPSPGLDAPHSAPPAKRTIPRPVGSTQPGNTGAQSPLSARRQQLSMARSVSFDAPKSPVSADATWRSSECLDKMADTEDDDWPEGEGQGRLQPGISIEEISTMTLTEFKKLISSSLAPPASSDVTADAVQTAGADSRGGARGGGDLSWSAVRDKAKSVCSSIASSVLARRPVAGGAGSVIAKRSLLKSAATDSTSRPKTLSTDRPRTPGITDRPKTPGVADRPRTPGVTDRPKTPGVTDRPKTPGVTDRPRTPGLADRSKPPSLTDRPRTPGITDKPRSLATAERPNTPCRVDRPKTVANHVRPNTPTASHVGRQKTGSDLEDRDDNVKTSTFDPRAHSSAEGVCATRVRPTVLSPTVTASGRPHRATSSDDVTDVPVTPRVKNSCFVYQEGLADGDRCTSSTSNQGTTQPSWTPSSDNDDGLLMTSLSRRSHSPVDDAEIASVVSSSNSCNSIGGLTTPGKSIRDRPTTPSRIPKPCFPPRPSTPSSDFTPATNGRAMASGWRADSTLQNPPAVTAGEKGYVDRYHARRALTPGPASPPTDPPSTHARPATPSSLSATDRLRQQVSDQGGSSRVTVDSGQLRKARSVTNLLHNGATSKLTHAAHVTTQSQKGTSSECASRPDRLVTMPHSNDKGMSRADGASFAVSRKPADEEPNKGTAPKHKGQEETTAVPRSRSVEPRAIVTIISRKPLTSLRNGGRRADSQDRVVTRTEAWVDSTLNDPKCRQLPARPKRSVTPNSVSMRDSELLSRPLKEIQAALPSPVDRLPVPDPETLQAPPEDPDMYRKMEQLFEKYREMELRASVCDIPGGGVNGTQVIHDCDNSSTGLSRSSCYDREEGDRGRGSGGVLKSSVSSRSSSSLRTTASSFSSDTPSAAPRPGHAGRTAHPSCCPSVDSDHQAKDLPHAAAAAASTGHYTNGAASNLCHSSAQLLDDLACPLTPTPTPDDFGAAEVVVSEREPLVQDPVALVSKIKEILKVRPRKEEGGKTGAPTRIPGPAHLSIARRSRSFTNLTCTNGHPSLASSSCPDTPLSDVGPLARSHATDNCFNFDLTRDDSTNSDVSSDVSRAETPVPKMTQPLTTGRCTLFRPDRQGGALRAVSLDDRPVSSSSSHSSTSRRFLDDSAEYF